MSQHHESDLRPAITGLLLSAVAVLIVVFGIVTMVNKSMGEKAASGHVTH